MPTLVVQAGHVGRPPNPGSRGTPGEQDFTASAAAMCRQLLDGRGGWRVQVVDADPPRAAYRGDAFVSIHCDGSNSPARRGASVGYRNGAGGGLAGGWKAAYQARGWSGGYLADNYTDNLRFYYGTGNAVGVGNLRAAILECGFLTSPADRELLLGAGGLVRVALAIGDAVGIPHGYPQEDPLSQFSDAVLYELNRGATQQYGRPTIADWAADLDNRSRRLDHDHGINTHRLHAIAQLSPVVLDSPAAGEQVPIVDLLLRLEAGQAAILQGLGREDVLERIDTSVEAQMTTLRAQVAESQQRMREAHETELAALREQLAAQVEQVAARHLEQTREVVGEIVGPEQAALVVDALTARLDPPPPPPA